MTPFDPTKSNPPRPENIPPPIEPVGVLTGVQARPILVGVVVDYIATFLAGSLYLIFFFSKEALEKGELSDEALDQFLSSPENLFFLGVIGVLCTVVGGYIAGRLAKNAEVKHGALVGVGSLIMAELTEAMLGSNESIPMWYTVASYLIAIPAGALGGYLSQRERELRAAYH